MLPFKRLTDLDDLLEIEYEKLHKNQRTLSISASPNVQNEAEQTIKWDIMPSIRKYETEYWLLLKQFASNSSSGIAEPDAQTAITTVIQDTEIILSKPMESEVLQKLQEILNKLNEPGTAAAAKAKFAVSLIPGVLAYEFEIDTENSLRQAFSPLKQLFGTAAKK